jgi:hypothetical protein
MLSTTEGFNINPPEAQEKKSNKLTYHHVRPFEAITYDIVRPKSPLDYGKDKEDARYWDRAYRWLENKLGFYPIFLAVGKTNEDVRMTGYQNQWRKLLVESKDYREYRRKGESPNEVLFSFNSMPSNGVFIDYDNWHLVLNLSDKPEELEKYTHSIFRPSWIKNDWITRSNKDPHSVQLVVPSLDLRLASQVTVRNKQTKESLIKMGFPNVVVGRLTLD